jgi:hypothetical protein
MSSHFRFLSRAALAALTVFCVPAQDLDTRIFKALQYRYIGPQGNRVDTIAGVPGDPNTIYAGAASGGIFKSVDGGVNSHRFSMASQWLPSVRWQWLRRITTPFGMVLVKHFSAVMSRLALAFISRSTAEKRGCTWVWIKLLVFHRL